MDDFIRIYFEIRNKSILCLKYLSYAKETFIEVLESHKKDSNPNNIIVDK